MSSLEQTAAAVVAAQASEEVCGAIGCAAAAQAVPNALLLVTLAYRATGARRAVRCCS